MLDRNTVLPDDPLIRVVGVGRTGISAVSWLIAKKISGVEFIGLSTNPHDQVESIASYSIQYDSNPEGEILKAIEGSELVLIVADMGCDLTNSAIMAVAHATREIKALSIAVVARPFFMEGQKRQSVAEYGIQNLVGSVDTTIVIQSDNLVTSTPNKSVPVTDAYDMVAEKLSGTVQIITDFILLPGLNGIDFADVKKVLSGGCCGVAASGHGEGEGEARAEAALQEAFACLKSEMDDPAGARSILVGIHGPDDLNWDEANHVVKMIEEMFHSEACILIGVIIDEAMKNGRAKVNIIAIA